MIGKLNLVFRRTGKWRSLASPLTVIPAKAGIQYGLSVQSLTSLEYWIARSQCAMAHRPGDDSGGVFVGSSLPGLTRQSIIFVKTLSKMDGYAGQARIRRVCFT